MNAAGYQKPNRFANNLLLYHVGWLLQIFFLFYICECLPLKKEWKKSFPGKFLYKGEKFLAPI